MNSDSVKLGEATMNDNYYEAPQTTEEPLANPRRSHSLPVLLVIGFIYIPGVLGLSLSVAMLVIAALAAILGGQYNPMMDILPFSIPFFVISCGVMALARQLFRRNLAAKPFAVMVLAIGTTIGLILMLFLGMAGLILAVPSLVGLCLISTLYTEDYCATRLDARGK